MGRQVWWSITLAKIDLAANVGDKYAQAHTAHAYTEGEKPVWSPCQDHPPTSYLSTLLTQKRKI